MLKVQQVGINKDALLKFHRELVLNLSRTRNLQFDTTKLDEFAEFSQLHSRVLLFGVQEIDNLDLSYQTAIYNNFEPAYGGLNELITKSPYNANAKAVSEWVINKLQFAERFLVRAETDDKVEAEFIALITLLETFLQKQYAKVLLPELVRIEDTIRAEINRIYELDLSAEEKQTMAFDFLDSQSSEAIQLFESKMMDDLNNEVLRVALLAVGIFLLPKLSNQIIEVEAKKAKFGYMSNVKAFFDNSIRRVKETFFDNVYSQRDLKQKQTAQISFNKNDFKLSVLAHPRAYFRGLIYQASKDKTVDYKLVVPSFVEPSLNPKGVTKKYLGKVKTFDQWSQTEGVANINVVNGLGLHHGSQEYYLPVISS